MRENRTSGLMSGGGNGAQLDAPPRLSSTLLKRQKNDVADAEAIVEAGQRPTMRFVEPKTKEQQSRAIVFRTREQFVNQRTELVNALRAHLYEFGYVAPQGIGHLPRLAEIVEDESADLPNLVRDICSALLDQIEQLSSRLAALKKTIDTLSKQAATSRRLQTMPGIGPIAALVIETFAPPMEAFKCGRDFAAWLGLVPSAEVERRQATTREGIEDGPARYSAVAHHRRHGCGSMGISEARARRFLACPPDVEETAHAGGNRAGQQDGAWHLGHADETGGLPRSGDGACVICNNAPETGTSGM
ncbi:MAG: IS110 family transposase [Mesorhizobium sp.]|nr:MAG: IS110 family transposase [Mesorhizobium sp.]RWI62809.1 MAG: IS110 family transposase [Mesorhizobium sp.]RWI81363.1 MAG: IS110 family transposase [Mesorhizobium sp.]RWJ42129.1 MAG: IS110 family transposase [Mesorhizobium sp.]RWJ56978.1 MAG: IS110 family transposase [Mesorhizobium sp.]